MRMELLIRETNRTDAAYVCIIHCSILKCVSMLLCMPHKILTVMGLDTYNYYCIQSTYKFMQLI